MRIEEETELTLGDLIVALTEKTLQSLPEEQQASILVANILSGLFHNSQPLSQSWH